ncbi:MULTISPECIES: RibD family protein [unclassified Microbacterium]|uniref:RibD family protein n=1 Tax=unclassified Microbacterium TaxID=2609290 RepID=UPI00097EFA79|nr:dihydrofolate reductase family protein [Microbacterium sp. JB110]RCS62809.1 deaminase [Microbacterium sp. JB110]SJM62475.1 5-amino-6-(5-phosphoribosylamino)uracil reductase [Frigoribacterium sp. JB110]
MNHAQNPPRPYVTASAAMSLDGYLDTASPPRLALSSDADFDRVDEVRAAHDAVLVGARTVRLDDPRLLVRGEERRQRRTEAGRSPNPTKVTVTGTGDLDPRARFFTAGDAEKVVYCPDRLSERLRHRLPLATVIGLGPDASVPGMLRDLGERSVASLMVEGGGRVLTQFLASGLVDELHLVVAPFFVGDRRAPRFVRDAEFPWTPDRRARLIESTPYGDVVLLRYGLSDRCDA